MGGSPGRDTWPVILVDRVTADRAGEHAEADAEVDAEEDAEEDAEAITRTRMGAIDALSR